MNILFNSEKLRRLLADLYVLAGIQTNIFDKNGADIQIFGNHSDFCRMMNDCPEGHRRCVCSDRLAVQHSAETRSPYMYRCHAGLREVVVPIFDGGEPVAFMGFGQVLDDAPYEEQWERTRATPRGTTGTWTSCASASGGSNVCRMKRSAPIVIFSARSRRISSLRE